MKKILLTLLLIISTNLIYSQDNNKPLIFTEVIDVDNTSQEELKTRAKIWFVENHIYPQDIIQVEENDQIIGHGGYGYYGFYIDFIVRIYFKDNKFKYEIDNFVHVFNNRDGGYGILTNSKINPNEKPKILGLTQNQWDKNWNYVIYVAQTETNELIKSLKISMKSIEINNNDW